MCPGGKVSGLLNFPVVHKKHTDISANTCQYSSSSGETVKSVTQTGNGVNVKPFKTCSLQHCLHVFMFSPCFLSLQSGGQRNASEHTLNVTGIDTDICMHTYRHLHTA